MGLKKCSVSDLGSVHHALFIAGCSVTAVAYVLTMIFERWLRHAHRIPGVIRKKERNFGIAALVFACIGALALVSIS